MNRSVCAIALLSAGLMVFWAKYGDDGAPQEAASGSDDVAQDVAVTRYLKVARTNSVSATTSRRMLPQRYASRSLGETSNIETKPAQPMTGQQLFETSPLAMKRIQEGLNAENRHLLRLCLSEIQGVSTNQDVVIDFKVSLDVRMDGEVGSIGAVEFLDIPRALSDLNRECLRETFQAISFDGSGSAFEGRVAFPIRYIIPRDALL